jgi:hypothetical protein
MHSAAAAATAKGSRKRMQRSQRIPFFLFVLFAKADFADSADRKESASLRGKNWIGSDFFRPSAFGFRPCLKTDRLIRPAALGAAGAIDVGVVCVNIAATPATEDTIFARSRLESAAAQFRVDRHDRQSAEQDHDVG